MTNRYVLIAGLVTISGAALAQNFTENFDTGPTGWIGGTTITFGNTAGGDSMAFASGTWHALNNSVPVGTTGWFSNPAVFPAHLASAGMANANFNNTTGTNTIDNFLMTPVRTLTNGDTLSFWTRTITTPAFPDRLIVKMSTSGASTSAASFSTTLLTINAGLTVVGYPNDWTQFTATVSGLGGPTSGRLAFNYNVTSGGPSGANSDFIGIDDVAYTSAVPEPATMAVLGLGAAALLRRRRRN